MTASISRHESERSFRIVTIIAGTSDPSSTRMLADRISDSVRRQGRERGASVRIDVIDARELAAEITTALVSQLQGPGLTRAVELLAQADGIVAATPVYKAGLSGLFTSFLDVLDNDLIIGVPVALAATAGTARHALVIDGQMRSQFAYLRALSVPTSVFAAPEDWSSEALTRRIDRVAFELLLLVESGFARAIKEETWGHYQHEFGSAGGTGADVDLDTDLMRLATGGTSSAPGDRAVMPPR